MRTSFACALLVWLLSGLASVHASTLSPSVVAWLDEAGPEDSVAVWIFFTDKGKLDEFEQQRLLESLAFA